MSEEPRPTASSTSRSEDEKKPQQAAAPTPVTGTQPKSAAAPAPSPPRPVPPVTPRPAAAPPPVPPSRPPQPRGSGRRNFLKAIVAVGAVLSLAPFVPWGSFLSSSVSSTGAYKRQKAVIDNNATLYGAAAGKQVNVNDLSTFPPNSAWAVTYPSSGDASLDAQNPDTFVKFALIRLPSELGGSSASASSFVAFSKVCVHLWCSPNYDPEHSTVPTDETYQCPCHGSIYRVPDGLSIAGPASQQPAPTNAIPMLTLTADSDGSLYIEPPVWDVDHNGVIGYGRNYESYEDYILPTAEGKGT